MVYNDNGTRFKKYTNYSQNKVAEYDYENNGILKHMMTPSIVNSKNQVLSLLRDHCEQCIIFILKYTDQLKNFKNYHWKNR
jgi:hypothetical protein